MKNLITFTFICVFAFISEHIYSQVCSPHVNVTTNNKTSVNICQHEKSTEVGEIWGIQLSVSTEINPVKNSFIIKGTINKNGVNSIAYFTFYNRFFNTQTEATSFASQKYSKNCYIVKRLDGNSGIFPITVYK